MLGLEDELRSFQVRLDTIQQTASVWVPQLVFLQQIASNESEKVDVIVQSVLMLFLLVLLT